MAAIGSMVAGVQAEILFSDNFTYPDGPLVTIAGARWSTHSGTAGQVEVVSGAIGLTQSKSEDVSAMLAGQPFPSNTNAVLYARCVVSFQSLPKGPNGGYFAHFKDGATGFRGRVFATTNGAAPGFLRLGIANAGNIADKIIETDLSVNTSYPVVLRWDVGNAVGTLWLNPTTEVDAGVTASDTSTAVSITAFALRQSLSSGNGMGALQVDDLVVSTSFAEAFSTNPPPILPPIIFFTNILENSVRPGDLPTNTFTEQCLRPGEKWTIRAEIADPNGRDIMLMTPATGLPSGAVWDLEPPAGPKATAVFTFQPTAAEAGRCYQVRLEAANDTATNVMDWTVYVPTQVEQGIVINEFLANPASTNAASHFNPLHRDSASPKPASDDEYIELVNIAGADVDLGGWTISDTVEVRHQFNESFVLAASNALVIYGGPLEGYAPNLTVAAVPASEKASGLGLNNTGSDSILVRNQDSNLVVRVVYSEKMLATNGSVTRFPDLDGAFVPHASVSTNFVSAGSRCDGRPFKDSETTPPAAVQTAIVLDSAGGICLTWKAEPERPYTVWQAEQANGPFTIRESGLLFADPSASYADSEALGVAQRFYRISTP